MNIDSIENLEDIKLEEIRNMKSKTAVLFAAGLCDIDLQKIYLVSPLFDTPIYFRLSTLSKDDKIYIDSVKNKFNKSLPYSTFFRLHITSYTKHIVKDYTFPKVSADIELIFGSSFVIGKYSGILKRENKLS